MLTAPDLSAVNANRAPAAYDSAEMLLAKLAIQTAPAVAHDQISDEDDFDFEDGKHYSVAIISGTATFSLPPVDEEPSVTVELPAGIATARFNSSTYVNVAAGADSVLVIETYAA